jgi:uncharacterized protein YggE
MDNSQDMSFTKQSTFKLLMSLLLIAAIAFVSVKAWNGVREHKFIGVPVERNTITVSGEGKVVVIPDLAKITLGMQVERKTVADAQAENTRIMNAIIEKVKSFEVDKKDIQTSSYNISPVYDYVDGRSVLRGYQVSQNIAVKVRNLDRVGDIIGAAGSLGANQVGGIDFTTDDIEKVKQEARIKAMENAKDKAEALADVTGVDLRRVISFNESFGGGYMPIYRDFDMKAEAANAGAPAPSIEAGSNEIIVNVSVTYEIE